MTSSSEHGFSLEPDEHIQWLVLVAFCISCQLIAVNFFAPAVSVDEAVPPVKIEAIAQRDEHGNYWAEGVIDKGPPGPHSVVINLSTLDELMLCPGIGRKTAENIIQERSRMPFRSWDDFAKRVAGIGSRRIEVLREAGVNLDPEGSGND